MPETSFTPTKEWNVTDELSPSVSDAIWDINQESPRQLISDLLTHEQRSKRSIKHSVLVGNNPGEYSATDALVIFNPFANGLTPNMLVRGEFVRRVAKFRGVTDDEGKYKPVILLANPDLRDCNLRYIDKTDTELVRQGEFGPHAKELLGAVSERGFGRVSLAGFSLGADMVLAAGREAYSGNLDVAAIAIGDPVGVESRSRRTLLRDFTRTGNKALKQSINNSGIEAQKVATDGLVGLVSFGISAAVIKANRAQYKGMGVDSFIGRSYEIIKQGKVGKITVAYGSESLITKPTSIEPSLALIDEDYPNRVESIKVNGANHAWGDQLTLLARLYMRAA
jgi:hypothetical protein